jgi:hypothetical protein
MRFHIINEDYTVTATEDEYTVQELLKKGDCTIIDTNSDSFATEFILGKPSKFENIQWRDISTRDTIYPDSEE